MECGARRRRFGPFPAAINARRANLGPQLIRPDPFATDSLVDEQLADKLLVLVALAGGGGFATTTLTGQARTQLDVTPRFRDVAFALAPAPQTSSLSPREGKDFQLGDDLVWRKKAQ